MKMNKGLNRRTFLRNVGLAAMGGLTGCTKVLPEIASLTQKNNTTNSKNKLPKWKGFNIPDFFQPNPYYVGGSTPEEFFKWIADWGFDFIRIPVAYPIYLDLAQHQ